MSKYSSAFKAYDIRSIWKDPVDEAFAYSMWRALWSYIQKKHWPDSRLCFGCDVRDPNNEMVYYFLCGLEDEWFQNYIGVGMEAEPQTEDQDYFWGVCSSAVLYAATRGEFDLGVMFTASHNPPEYVGLKIVDTDLAFIPTSDLKDLVTERHDAPERDDERFQSIRQRAMGTESDLSAAVDAQLEDMTLMLTDRFTDIEKSYTIVVDYAGAAATTYERLFFEEVLTGLGHTIIHLNEKSDSDFSSHLADTADPHEYAQLITKVQKHKADLGIMFDGDADRLGMVDSDGRFVTGDILLAIIIQAIGADIADTTETIGYDLFCSKIVHQTIESIWHKPHRTRIGAALIKDICREQDIYFAWEISAHHMFKETSYGEMPLLSLMYLLMALDTYESSAIMIDLFTPTYKPAQINLPVEDPREILQTIQKEYADYDIDLTDGVRVDSDDRWFCVRASNTEPIIRVVMEAQDEDMWKEQMEKLKTYL